MIQIAKILVFGLPLHIGTRASLRRMISVNFIFSLLLVNHPTK